MKSWITFNRIVFLLFAGILLNLAYILYMVSFPFKTVEFHNQPFPVLNQRPIHPGDVLIYKVDYCRYTSAPSELNRTLTGPTVITIVQDTATADTGCRIVKVANTVIPSYAPHGVYYLKINVCFHVNPLRNICQQIRTESFNVE